MRIVNWVALLADQTGDASASHPISSHLIAFHPSPSARLPVASRSVISIIIIITQPNAKCDVITMYFTRCVCLINHTAYTQYVLRIRRVGVYKPIMYINYTSISMAGLIGLHLLPSKAFLFLLLLGPLDGIECLEFSQLHRRENALKNISFQSKVY